MITILFDPRFARLRSSPEDIFCSIGGLSHGEIILVSLAMDIWNGSGETNLYEAIRALDDACWNNFLNALAVFSHQKESSHNEVSIDL
ncbi:MAG: hypothetical protein JNM39_12130 [Bdellovibrionaceae bacterium]|nr:hypothetical protein [Pseudobdellovibrionaceae bacterium]